MSILIDCSNIRTGGAIQNALTFIKSAKKYGLAKNLYLVCSPIVDNQLSFDDKNSFKEYTSLKKIDGFLDIFKNSLFMSKYENKINPKIVFTIAGPSYWKAKSLQVVGFARPHFIYPEIDIFYRYGAIKKLYSIIKLNIKKKIHSFFFKRSDYLVCQTNIVKNRVVRELNFSKEKIFVIRNGYSIIFKNQVIKILKNRNINKKKLKKKVKKVIFVPSAYYVHKNLEILPVVAKQLVYKNFNLIFKMTLDPKNKDVENLNYLINKHDVKKNFKFLGNLNHKLLAKEYLNSDLVLLPTLLECSTAVYPEAMMCRIPLLTSKLDFSLENCENGALYFNPFNSDDIVKKIDLIFKNKKLGMKLSSSGLKVLKKKYISPYQKFKTQFKILKFLLNNELK